MSTKRKINRIPRDVRKQALEAIKKGINPEAIERYNAVADEINKVSFYEAQVREHVLHPYFIVVDEAGDVDEKIYE